MMNWREVATWAVSLAAIALVLIRPKRLPEALWAVAGALLLVILRLISPVTAAHAAAQGTDVYLFLTGMMVISELARRQGVFDWVAAHAVGAARGSRSRLFVLVYGVGIIVTVFLSNDATAVVLTPAVLAAVRAADADPLPYLLVCAFIANAASFVLPISNPANLVVYNGGMPPLNVWVATFGLASLASIAVTFVALRWVAGKHLHGPVKPAAEARPLSREGRITLFGIAFLAIVLLIASALNINLGAPACGAGFLVALTVSLRDRSTWRHIATGVSWSVLPLVAGLFVIVAGLDSAGALRHAAAALRAIEAWPSRPGAIAAGFGVAILSNLMNNLPSGLIAAAAVKSAHTTGILRDAVLVGVDVGPNLSVTGSLATILWLIAIRRDGLHVGFWDFLKWGMLVMAPALLCAILVLR